MIIDENYKPLKILEALINQLVAKGTLDVATANNIIEMGRP
jgi:hypothetical protein